MAVKQANCLGKEAASVFERFVADIAPKDPALGTNKNGGVHGASFEVVKYVVAPECFKSGIGKNREGECPPGLRGLLLRVSQPSGKGGARYIP